MKRKQVWMAGILVGLSLAAAVRAAPPAPAGRTEELKNLRWGMFVCWSFSTFSGYEWTPGVEDIDFFHPTGFDPDQWCRVAKDAGMGYILFLTKHHDGFCLWDTATTDRKVTKTRALRDVDVLAEVRKACDRHGLKLALYFSEGDWSWSPERKDIHRPSASRPDLKKAQLKELLTNYGPIEFFWMDHAVGDGGLPHADTVAFVKEFQPGCFVGFNHGDQAGADIHLRERGRAGAAADPYALAEFTYPILEGQGRTKLRGAQWFYSLPENDRFCVSAEKIYADYLGAVRFGNVFSLDVGPDRSGRLRAIDVETLGKVGRYIRGELAPPPETVPPLSQGKPCRASGAWADSPGFGAEKAFDGDPSSRWGAPADARDGWLEVDLQEPREVGRAVILEGAWDRVRSYELRAEVDGAWKTLAAGDRLGERRVLSFAPVTARRFRFVVLKADEVPTIHEFQLFAP